MMLVVVDTNHSILAFETIHNLLWKRRCSLDFSVSPLSPMFYPKRLDHSHYSKNACAKSIRCTRKQFLSFHHTHRQESFLFLLRLHSLHDEYTVPHFHALNRPSHTTYIEML